MKKSLSQTGASKEAEKFFMDIKNKSEKDIKKIKRLAMSYKISLKEKRKLFCKKCLNPYITSKIRIRKGVKSIACEKCGYINKWKIKLF